MDWELCSDSSGAPGLKGESWKRKGGFRVSWTKGLNRARASGLSINSSKGVKQQKLTFKGRVVVDPLFSQVVPAELGHLALEHQAEVQLGSLGAVNAETQDEPVLCHQSHVNFRLVEEGLEQIWNVTLLEVLVEELQERGEPGDCCSVQHGLEVRYGVLAARLPLDERFLAGLAATNGLHAVGQVLRLPSHHTRVVRNYFVADRVVHGSALCEETQSVGPAGLHQLLSFIRKRSALRLERVSAFVFR